MNREIQFRAWDRSTNKMIVTGFHVFGEVTLFNLIEIYLHEHPVDGKCSLERLNDVEVMQLTGLFDKNKIPIYEEDILQYCDGRKFVVEWNKNMAGLWAREIKDYGNGPHGLGFDETEQQEWEVLGNSFENPELIKP